MKALLIIAALIAAIGAAGANSATIPQAPPDQPSAPPASYSNAAYAMPQRPGVDALTNLGRALFFDPSLSASGRQSCATCHSPDHAFGPPNDLSVQLGGRQMKLEGTRAAPSLRYMQHTPPFSEHYHDDDNDDTVDAGPTGGRNWDGRVDSASE